MTGIRSLQERPNIFEPHPFDSSSLDLLDDEATLLESLVGELYPEPWSSSSGMIRGSSPNMRSSSLYSCDRLNTCSSNPLRSSERRVSECDKSIHI